MLVKLYRRRIGINESNCLVRSRLMTVRPTAGMINLIYGQMAGITRAYSAEPLAIALRGKCTTWLCAHSIAIDRCYVLEVSTGPKFPARPAKCFFLPGPARNQCIIKIFTVQFF